VKVPVNHMLPSATIATIVDEASVRALVFDDAVADVVAGLDPAARDVVCLQAGDADPIAGATRLARTGEAAPSPPLAADPEDPAAIYFTGGTTGKPKGVLHTQRSTTSLHYAQLLEAEIADTDRLLLMTPLAHAAGLFAQSAVIRGATIVLTDGFDARRALELIEREDVTWTFLVPTMLYRMLDVLESGDARRASTLRTIVYGAAPIAPARLVRALDVFGPVFIQLYGQTECPNWGTRLTKQDHDPEHLDRLASCGRASIMADVQVVDDDGRTLPAGETGEICLRSPYVLREYVNNPDATREKFLGPWIRTGDIGVLDDDGYLYLRDRKNDMVISGGMNVYCREVEDVLIQHDAVGGVAVIGVPHDDWGESVHACVVRSTPDLTEADLLTWSRSRLAAYARPKSVEFVDSLPETPFGKIDKKALRAPYWEGRSRAIG
jgi:fatty-acyl-CoA synthase/long-chain acyl-CoA synthetase